MRNPFIGMPAGFLELRKGLVEAADLKAICPRLHPDRSVKIANHINIICPQYGINTADILHEFLARLIHECREFTRYEENLYYSADRLTKVWPKRFPTIVSAKPYAMNPKLLAERVYGMRKDLGNTQPGDGFMFRGSGPMQTTGRGNVTRFGEWMESQFGIKKTPEQWAEALRTSDEYGIHSACWIFAISMKLIDEAIDDNLLAIVKRINGGVHGLEDTKRIYELCKIHIPIAA